ncbi:hypothetical protein OUZ56_019570 [Daphnia magna]|uniref:HAT C-terminal dimerisation domain-containing protein n=1 Tax=Daphnia magna TaxID=35525 RepID=A0ABQ9ZBY8_9CRUS|nr:hypothetical protein OUZ56_019570 [Daphnia magna]
MKSRFDFTDPVYEVVTMLHPENARNLKPRTLSALFERFTFCDRLKTEKEWNAHALLPTSAFGVLTESAVFRLPAEEYWQKVFANDEATFANLCVFVSMLFSLIVSNVIAKRKFSELNNTKTDKRTSIDDDTVVSLMRIKSWLKAHDKSADEVNITDELVQAVIKVKSNATIPDSKSF